MSHPSSLSVVNIGTEDVLRRALLASLEIDERLSRSGSGLSTPSSGSRRRGSNSSGGGGGGSSAAAVAARGAQEGKARHRLRGSSPSKTALRDTEELATKDILSIAGGCHLDWVLADADPLTSRVQTLEEEVRRLAVLKSYNLLETEKSRCFDRYTEMAARLYECPVSMISLLDIGRAWILSNVGVDERIREGPRKLAFCAHTILSAEGTMVVNDSLLDARFRDSPYATAPEGGIRFYAGACLVSPEGYRLGTICVVDHRPRPEGLSESQLRTLKDMAEMIVDVMVTRRATLEHESARGDGDLLGGCAGGAAGVAESIACASHDLLTPLSGALLSLSLLKEDAGVQSRLDPAQRDLLATAAACTDVVVRLCESSIDGLRSRSSPGPSDASGRSGPSGDRAAAAASSRAPDAPRRRHGGKVTRMDQLLESFRAVLEPMPRSVPVVVRLAEGAPLEFACDDLKLFRSGLNLLSSAAARTASGHVCLTIGGLEPTGDLVFECEDTAAPVPESSRALLYRRGATKDGDLGLGLFSVAHTVRSLGGEYGYCSRGRTNGSVFWFRVPAGAEDSNRTLNGSVRRQRDPVMGPPPTWKAPSAFSRASQSPSSPPLPNAAAGHAATATTTGRASCFGSLFDAVVASSQSAAAKGPAAPPASALSARADGEGLLRSTSLLAHAPNLPAVSGMSPQRRRSRALVIDDSLVVRKSISMALKRFGFDVTVASDGLEGLNAMKQTTFDLVLCDFLMPVMDGLDCTKQYREWEAEVSNPPPSLALPLLSAPRPPGYRQLIVGMSAHGAEQVASQGLVAGMDDFLPKPIGVPTLKELVESSKVRDMSNVLDSIEAAHDALQTPALDSDVVENDSGGVSSPLHTGSTGEFARRVSSSLEHVSTVNHSDIALTDPPARQPLKRPRSDADNSMSEPHCLIATHQPEPWIAAVTASIESQGWKTTVVHAPASALRMLQSRNWDLVLICEEPFRTGGGSEVPEESPVSQFRSWERHNRINLQKNVCWLTDLDLPSRRDPASCMVLAPRGYDHVLRKPVLWDDLRLLLGTHRTDSTMSIVVNK